MFRYNLSPIHNRPAYSIESYEPIDLLPEEQQQNNNFIKLALISKTYNKNNFHIPPNLKIRNISNNTQDSITKNLFGTKPLTESNQNNLYKISNPNTLYTFNINKRPRPVLSPVKISNHNLIRQEFFNPILNQNSFNYANNNNITNIPIVNNFHNIPRVQNTPHLMTRCKSSNMLTQVKYSPNNHLNNNQILLPVKIRKISPPRIIQTNIFSSPKKVIPIYQKIIYHRKKY